MRTREERLRRRREALDEAHASSAARDLILAGVDSALACVSDTISEQGRRISEESFGKAQRDMDTFVLAADRLKGISTAMGDLGIDVAPFRGKFESATPHIRTARDVFSHYEDYLLGAGQRQDRRGEPVSMVYQRSATAGTAVRMTNPDIVVDIGAAIAAAGDFAADLANLVAIERLKSHPGRRPGPADPARLPGLPRAGNRNRDPIRIEAEYVQGDRCSGST